MKLRKEECQHATINPPGLGKFERRVGQPIQVLQNCNANHSKIYLNTINCDKILGFSRDLRKQRTLLELDIPKYSNNPCNIISTTNIFFTLLWRF